MTRPDEGAAAPSRETAATNLDIEQANPDNRDSTSDSRTFAFSTAPSRTSAKWSAGSTTISDFRERIENPAHRKECGNAFFGELRGGRRTKATVVSRSWVALDADDADEELWADVEALGAYALVHTTWNSGVKSPLRLRIYFPLARDVTPDEYRRLAATLLDRLGKGRFDAGSVEAERYMFLPSVPEDRAETYRWAEYAGPLLDPDAFLTEGEAEARPATRKPATELRGTVGAVARAYSIAELVEKYLPETYTPVGPDRYAYSGGDGSPGLHEYASGYVKSHQTSDPASGEARTGFDLVRIHRFGRLDADAIPGTRVAHLPSHEAARALFEADERVVAELSSDGPATSSGRGPGRPSAAREMVDLAATRYRLLLGPDRDLYASPLDEDGAPSPYVLWEEDGSLAADLGLTYAEATGKIPSTSAKSDAVAHLRALTRRNGTPERIFRRVARIGDESWINLGDGRRVVRVAPGNWATVEELPPGLNFRRSATMAEQVLPATPGTGDVARLWDHVNVSEEDRPLVLAWAVHALVDSDAPHAALLFTGGQGAGKSTATERMTDLVDPTSAHPTRKTADERAWVIRAMSSWVLVVDNLSSMSSDFSDLLATTATGSGVSYRKLYTNGELVTATLLNPMILNGITVDGMRPDLLDRTVAIRLDRIPPTARKDSAAQTALWRRDRPVVFAGLLDLAARVMERDVLGLVDVPEGGLPRMTGYARVLLAVDELLGTDGFRTFLGHGRTAAAETVSADPILDAIARLVTARTVAPAGDLVRLLDRDDELVARLAEERRPLNSRSVAKAIRRGSESLEALGWTVHDRAEKGKAGVTLWTIEPPADEDGAR